MIQQKAKVNTAKSHNVLSDGGLSTKSRMSCCFSMDTFLIAGSNVYFFSYTVTSLWHMGEDVR